MGVSNSGSRKNAQSLLSKKIGDAGSFFVTQFTYSAPSANRSPLHELHSAVTNGRWFGDQRPLCGVSGQDISKAFRRQW